MIMNPQSPSFANNPDAVCVELFTADGEWLAGVALPAVRGEERLREIVSAACLAWGGRALHGHRLKVWGLLADPRMGGAELIAHLSLGLPESIAGQKTRSKEPEAYALLEGPLSLMPDYGGASLWLASGSNTNFTEADWLATSTDLARSRFEKSVDEWQLHFEARAELPSMNWSSFNSKGDALALRSRALLRHPLRHKVCFESPRSFSSGAQEWASFGALADLANDALENLDEPRFIDALKNGARQSATGRGMTWAAYCCHFGLESALAELAAAEPRALSMPCRRGATPCMAAILEIDPRCLQIALSGHGFLADPALAEDLFNCALQGSASMDDVCLCAEELWGAGCNPMAAWRKLKSRVPLSAGKGPSLLAGMERLEMLREPNQKKQPAKAGCLRL